MHRPSRKYLQMYRPLCSTVCWLINSLLIIGRFFRKPEEFFPSYGHQRNKRFWSFALFRYSTSRVHTQNPKYLGQWANFLIFFFFMLSFLYSYSMVLFIRCLNGITWRPIRTYGQKLTLIGKSRLVPILKLLLSYYTVKYSTAKKIHFGSYLAILMLLTAFKGVCFRARAIYWWTDIISQYWLFRKIIIAVYFTNTALIHFLQLRSSASV